MIFVSRVFCCLTIVLFLFIDVSLLAQDKKQLLDEKRDDIFKELSDKKLTLRFYNALNGKPIEGALIIIPTIGEFTTSDLGTIDFEIPTDGVYPFVFKHPKYIESSGEFEVMATSLFFNRFSTSPLMDINNLRIVLEWDDKPRDLDANLLKIGGYHISYRKKKIADDGEAQLDRDDMDGEGPETITVLKTAHHERYVYFVEDFSNRRDSNSKALVRSKAVVRVYGEGRLMQSISIPRNAGKGNKWLVFEIVNGQINVINAVE